VGQTGSGVALRHGADDLHRFDAHGADAEEEGDVLVGEVEIERLSPTAVPGGGSPPVREREGKPMEKSSQQPVIGR